MTPLLEGFAALVQPDVILAIVFGAALGMLVGAFPGITATMAVALASGFTLTMEPIPALGVILAIYVSANFGDRVPSILVNTPGTPASIPTTFDGYPMARKGMAGVALTSSALASAVGTVMGVILLMAAAIPLARVALMFGPAEMFALVVFGLTMMVGIAGASPLKGLAAGAFGLLLSTIGRDPITGQERFTFSLMELGDGIPFIAALLGIYGIAEVFEQIYTHRGQADKVTIRQFGQWWPSRKQRRTMLKPLAVGSATGMVVGVVPGAGGDIAGLVAWDQARRASKHKEEFGKGSLEGLVAPDTASNACLGGSVTTTLALGVPGDSVMAIVIGSMIIWGIQPGPGLFSNQPELVYSIAGIMLAATILATIMSLLRVRGVVKLLELPPVYLWAIIIVFCMVGSYAVGNSTADVIIMFLFGIVGFAMRRTGFPVAPVVLALVLGDLAESNLRRALEIGGIGNVLTSPIALTLLLLSIAALIVPPMLARRTTRRLPASGHVAEHAS
ncbi:MAG: tripartite tricarboxylate transporter permease [Beutenbergiaceae bacterium]